MSDLDLAPITDVLVQEDLGRLTEPTEIDPDRQDIPIEILEPIGSALLSGAQTILLAFVAGMVGSAKGGLTVVGQRLATKVTDKLNKVISRGDKKADAKELEEEVEEAKKAKLAGSLSEADAEAAEAAVVDALVARGFDRERAELIASRVRASGEAAIAG